MTLQHRKDIKFYAGTFSACFEHSRSAYLSPSRQKALCCYASLLCHKTEGTMKVNLLCTTWLVQACLLTIASPTATAAVGFRTVDMFGSLRDTTLKYRVNPSDPNAPNGEDTISIEYSAPTDAWLGIGFSSSGLMIPSDAVIGLPATGEVKKYALAARNVGGVNQLPAEEQTLINAQINQSGGVTTMSYTKIIDEDGDIAIDVTGGSNNMIGAFGFTNSLAFHDGFGTFAATLDASPTEAPTAAAPAESPTEPPEGVQIVELTDQLEGSTLSYEFDQDSIIMTLTVPTSGWLAVGVSNTGTMIGSEAVIGYPDTGEVKKFNLNAKNTAGIVEMPEERQTLTNTEVTVSGGQSTMTFTKLLKEEGEIPINADEDTIFIASFATSSTSTLHAGRGSFKLSRAAVSGRDNSLWVVHGWLAAIAWGVLCPLAIMAGLFRKFIPGEGVWFQIHRALNSLVVLLTIAAVVVAVVALNDETPEGLGADHFNSDLSDGHRLIGLIILILALVQVINGAFRPHLPEKSAAGDDEEGGPRPLAAEEKSGMRKLWEVGHRLFGLVVLGLCWYQIQLGIKWYHNIFNDGDYDDTLTIFWAVIGTLGAIVVIGIVMRVVTG